MSKKTFENIQKLSLTSKRIDDIWFVSDEFMFAYFYFNVCLIFNIVHETICRTANSCNKSDCTIQNIFKIYAFEFHTWE